MLGSHVLFREKCPGVVCFIHRGYNKEAWGLVVGWGSSGQTEKNRRINKIVPQRDSVVADRIRIRAHITQTIHLYVI